MQGTNRRMHIRERAEQRKIRRKLLSEREEVKQNKGKDYSCSNLFKEHDRRHGESKT